MAHAPTDDLAWTAGFTRVDGALCCAGRSALLPVAPLAEEYGTPLYVTNADAVLARYARYAAAWAPLPHRVCYAVKANGSLALLRALARAGAGFDVTSRGELYRALRAGAEPSAISMTGVGKSAADIDDALAAGIRALHAESAEECARISAAATALGRTATVLLRVNPDVETDTHPHISTGDAEHKFGMTADALQAALPGIARLPGLRLAGFSMHIGSQLRDPEPFVEGLRVLADFVRTARPLLAGPPVVDIGGGFGVAYAPGGHEADPAQFARAVGAALQAEGLEDATVLTEPGRWLVANASILVARVEYVKRNAGRTFVVLDAGMNDLIRPALYGAAHAITLLDAADAGPVERLDIVGPVCESSDVFAVDLPFPVPRAGALVAILSAGAYGMSMASTYNSRPLPAEAACIEGAWQLVRARMTLEEMVAQERLPE